MHNYPDYLSLDNGNYQRFLVRYFENALEFDDYDNDITSLASFDENDEMKGFVIAKEPCVVSGVAEILWVNEHTDLFMGMNAKALKSDGDKVKEGEKILELNGNAIDIASLERTLLNFLQPYTQVMFFFLLEKQAEAQGLQ